MSPIPPLIADPRRFPAAADAPAPAQAAHALAAASLRATTGRASERLDRDIDAMVAAVLRDDPPAAAGAMLAAWLGTAPSLDVRRHLWRALARAAGPPPEGAIAVTLFAVPLVLVAGVAEADAPATLPRALPDPRALASCLVEHGALAGNRSVALAGALVAADAIDVGALPGLLRARDAVLAGGGPLDLAGAPLHVPAGESVHLRFLVGSALGAAAVDVLRDATTGRWGMPLTKLLAAQLGAGGVTLLPLPRPALGLLAAVAQGRVAQRDVSAQLFASNAIRQLRASVGEPVAVISAHEAADAVDGGELRLSLSSPLSVRDAYGFRCPILPLERAVDAATMLADLMRDARVADVRMVAGMHADRDPVTGGPLLFKPGSIPAPH